MSAKLRLHVARATFASLAVVLALAVVGVVVLGGGRAAAVQQLSCGDTITTDVTLHHNLVDCPNNGIIIGADNITFDLNYHTIAGDGTPTAGCDPRTEFCDEGLPNLGHDGVTVMHGSIREFAAGPEVANARHVRLLDISSTGHDFFGAAFFKSARSVVRNGSYSRNVPPEGDGIGVFGSNHIRIVRNKIRRNPGPGIHVDRSNENLIKGNRLSRGRDVAILVESDHNRVLRNRLIRGAGIVVAKGKRNVIARNRIHKVGLDAIGINKGHGNLVARNDIFRPHGSGVYLGHPLIGGHDNLIRRNFVRASGAEAYLVKSEDRQSRLKRNVAIGAGEDGFGIESRSAKLTKNRALRNRDLGIEAVRGVRDGGGNVARRNGDPRQCTHIVCR